MRQGEIDHDYGVLAPLRKITERRTGGATGYFGTVESPLRAEIIALHSLGRSVEWVARDLAYPVLLIALGSVPPYARPAAIEAVMGAINVQTGGKRAIDMTAVAAMRPQRRVFGDDDVAAIIYIHDLISALNGADWGRAIEIASTVFDVEGTRARITHILRERARALHGAANRVEAAALIKQYLAA